MPHAWFGEVALAAAFALLVVSHAVPAGAAVPVEGDAALLRQLREVQASSRAQLQRGSLRAKVVEHGRIHHDMDLEFIWDGERRYWKCSGTTVVRIPGTPESRESFADVYLIHRPDAKFIYNPGLGFASIYSRSGDVAELQDILTLDPRVAWYHYERGSRSWEWMLDPDEVASSTTRFVVRKEPPERVVIERHLKNGGSLRVEASLAHGGNIIAYQADSDGTISDGRYDWAKDERGGWYVQEAQFQRYPRDAGPERPLLDYRVRISEFQKSPSIRTDQFEFAGLPIAPRTVVTQYAPDGKKARSWRFGEARGGLGEPVSESVLRRLSEQARAQGFSSPDRDD